MDDDPGQSHIVTVSYCHVSIPTLLLPYTVHVDDDPSKSYIIQLRSVCLEHSPVKHNLFLADYLTGHSSVT